MKRQKFLETKQTDLVLLIKSDAEILAAFMNDHEVTTYLNQGAIPLTYEEELEYIDKAYKNHQNLVFGIWHTKDEKLIGATGLHRIDYANQQANFGISIGNKDYWGKSVGTEVTQEMLSYAFMRLNLRNVRLSVYGHNERAQKCYRKCGFRKVGCFEKSVFKNGQWEDEVLMVTTNPIYS